MNNPKEFSMKNIIGTMDKYRDEAIRKLYGQQETIIGKALDNAIPGWTLETVKARCEFVKIIGTSYQTLLVDGVPVLELHDPEFSAPRYVDDMILMEISQKYRRVP